MGAKVWDEPLFRCEFCGMLCPRIAGESEEKAARRGSRCVACTHRVHEGVHWEDDDTTERLLRKVTPHWDTLTRPRVRGDHFGHAILISTYFHCSTRAWGATVSRLFSLISLWCHRPFRYCHVR